MQQRSVRDIFYICFYSLEFLTDYKRWLMTQFFLEKSNAFHYVEETNKMAYL